jgi:hypothetical protein
MALSAFLCEELKKFYKILVSQCCGSESADLHGSVLILVSCIRIQVGNNDTHKKIEVEKCIVLF